MNLETSAGVKWLKRGGRARSPIRTAQEQRCCCCCCQQGGPDKFEGERERERGAHTHAHTHRKAAPPTPGQLKRQELRRVQLGAPNRFIMVTWRHLTSHRLTLWLNMVLKLGGGGRGGGGVVRSNMRVHFWETEGVWARLGGRSQHAATFHFYVLNNNDATVGNDASPLQCAASLIGINMWNSARKVENIQEINRLNEGQLTDLIFLNSFLMRASAERNHHTGWKCWQKRELLWQNVFFFLLDDCKLNLIVDSIKVKPKRTTQLQLPAQFEKLCTF